MPPGTPDDLYLSWLYGQVAIVRTRKSSNTYWELLKKFFTTEFVWFVPNDDNRAEDGKALRHEWIYESQTVLEDPEWMSLGCSFLELLIGVSRRLDFETDQDVAYWFWHLVDNLELRDYNDRNFVEQEVEDRIQAVIWRTYSRDGHGGLFPLKHTTRDQRRVEIWYQLSEYLLQDA
jgi:hypothetical protein